MGISVQQPQAKIVENIPTTTISPVDLPEGRRSFTPEQQGLLFSAGAPASGEARVDFYKGTGYPEVSYSREALEAAKWQQLGLTATGVAVATLPVSATAAYGAGGLLGLAKFGGELVGGLVASEVVRQQAPPLLEAAIPGKKPEVYKTGGEALGFAGFIVGAKGVSSGFKAGKEALFGGLTKESMKGEFVLGEVGKKSDIFYKGIKTKEIVGKGLRSRVGRRLFPIEKIAVETKTDLLDIGKIPRTKTKPAGLKFAEIGTEAGRKVSLETGLPSAKFELKVSPPGAGETIYQTPTTALGVSPKAGKEFGKFLEISQFKGTTKTGKGAAKAVEQLGFPSERAIRASFAEVSVKPEDIAPLKMVTVGLPRFFGEAKVPKGFDIQPLKPSKVTTPSLQTFFKEKLSTKIVGKLGKDSSYSGRVFTNITGQTVGLEGIKQVGGGTVRGSFTFEGGKTISLKPSRILFVAAEEPNLAKVGKFAKGKGTSLSKTFGSVQQQKMINQTIGSTKDIVQQISAAVAGAGKDAGVIAPSYLKSLAIPGSATALAVGLPKRPKAYKVEKFDLMPYAPKGFIPSAYGMPDFIKMPQTGIGKVVLPGKKAGIGGRTMIGVKTGFYPAEKLGIGTKVRVGTRLDLGVGQKIGPQLKYAYGTKMGVGEKISPQLRYDYGTKLRVGEKISPQLRYDYGTKLRLAERLRIGEKLKFGEKLRPFTISPFIDSPPPPPPPGGLLFPKPRKGKSQLKWAEGNLGFKLEVRRKGKFVPVFGKQAFSEKTAKRLAQQLVGGTPLASFRLTKVRAPRLTEFGGLPSFKPEQYRKPIRRGKYDFSSKTFIEKNKYRIDEPGEFRGITLKGLMAPRKKKKKKRKSKKRRRR